ncbi:MULTISPECIES: cell division protein DivIVA [unclassified Corynebacterium]|uniref:cell division protein DivIVA n=1 Tax=unclassified Corynebacterium TaxID=2624378 RepID=UPI0035236347
MLTWIIYICVLLVLVVVFTVVFGVLFGRGESLPPLDEQLPDIGAANDSAVWADRPEDIRLPVTLRGYRMEEVDRLVATYEEKIAALRSELNRCHGKGA